VIVLDTSAAIEWLLGRPGAQAVAGRLTNPDTAVHAPHLLTIETAQVLRRFVLAGALRAGRGEEALRDLDDLDVTLYDHGPFLPRIWRLRGNLTAYDAAYVALAEALDATLVTMDARIAAAPVHRATIDVVSADEQR